MRTQLLRGILSLPILVLLSACAAPAEEATEANDLTRSFWQPLLVCNGGGAVLDVDAAERRHLQFVVRDSNAISYVTGAIRQQMRLNRGNGREIIAGGYSQEGAFAPGDFRSFYEEATDYTSRIDVAREGRGVRIRFSLHRREGGFCTDWCSETCCGGYAGGHDAFDELASWYFDDCR